MGGPRLSGATPPSTAYALGAETLSGDPDKLLTEVAEAIASGDPDRINRTSINLIAQYIGKNTRRSFAMITSVRDTDMYGAAKDAPRSARENVRDFSTFERELKSRNVPYTKMKGRWKSEDGSLSSEACTFVYGTSRKDTIELGYKHHQQVVAYNGPETQGRTHIVWMDYANGNTSHHGSELFDDLGEFRPDHGRLFMLARRGGKNAFPLPQSLESNLAGEYGWIEYEPENIGQVQKLGRLVGLARAKRSQ